MGPGGALGGLPAGPSAPDRKVREGIQGSEGETGHHWPSRSQAWSRQWAPCPAPQGGGLAPWAFSHQEGCVPGRRQDTLLGVSLPLTPCRAWIRRPSPREAEGGSASEWVWRPSAAARGAERLQENLELLGRRPLCPPCRPGEGWGPGARGFLVFLIGEDSFDGQTEQKLGVLAPIANWLRNSRLRLPAVSVSFLFEKLVHSHLKCPTVCLPAPQAVSCAGPCAFHALPPRNSALSSSLWGWSPLTASQQLVLSPGACCLPGSQAPGVGSELECSLVRASQLAQW